MARQACVDCHFFTKSYRDSSPPHVFVVSEKERSSTNEGDFSWHDENKAPVALACAMEVWDQGVAGFPHDRRHEFIVKQVRKNFCFFWRHHPGMLLSAAKELQRREMAAADSRKEQRLTIYGLWLAALALLASVVLELVNLVKQ
jgi:hypothetical protein